jgi:hypothetical protein
MPLQIMMFCICSKSKIKLTQPRNQVCLTLMVMPFSPSKPASVGGRILLVANVRKGSKAASLAKSTEPQLLGQTDALQLACRAPWNLGRNCSVPSRTKTQGFKSAKSAQRFVRPRAGLQHVQHAMAFETASDPRQFRTAANNSWSDATAAVAYAVRFLVARSFINMSTINMSTPSRQFQDSISVRARWRWPSTSPAKRERGQCNDDPCAVTAVRLSAEGGVDRLFVAKG